MKKSEIVFVKPENFALTLKLQKQVIILGCQ